MTYELARSTRTTVAREWGTVVDRLLALDDAGWRTPTRCAGWDVTDLVRHLVWGVSMEADALRRRRTGEAGPADGYEAPADTSSADLVARLRQGLTDLLGELDELDADAERLVPMPYGDVPVPVVLEVFSMEAGVHADDLAHALGHQQGLAPDVIEPTTSVLAAFLPVLAANGTPSPDGTSISLAGERVRLHARWSEGALTISRDDEVPAPASASASAAATVTGGDSALLLFALGRVGLDDSGLTVTGDEELARSFKSHVPGP